MTKNLENIYLPNEIFLDLQKNIDNSRQIAFAYSYLYYITYLYRYCKYIDDNGEKVTQERIKEFLSYAPKNKKVDYIIKKGGILDNMNYTSTTTDYPIQYFFDENLIIFETINDFKNDINKLNDRNFKIKRPMRSFHRNDQDIASNELTGTFYEVENTHRIEFSTFKKIITIEKLGVVAFYIYAYLKHKNDIFKHGYQRSAEKLGLELAMSERTIRKYVASLEIYGLINIEHKSFNLELAPEDREANIYNVI